MRFRTRSSKGVFGLSLTEVAFLLVFLLLALISTSITKDPDIENTKMELADLEEYQKLVEEVLDTLGVSLEELRKVASRLIAADLVEKPKLNLIDIIDQLLADNKRLRNRIDELEKKTVELTQRTQRAEDELRRLGKAVVGEGGTEPGSCWFDADGQIEYFLHVVIHDDRLDISSAWQDNRRRDLEAMGVNPASVPSGEIRNEAFSRFAGSIYLKTVDQGCRLFVRLVDRTTNKDAYKQQRKLVERYFFVLEVER